MAPPHNQPLSFSTEHSLRRCCSKAQMCFFKILHIISVLPAGDVTDEKCLGHQEEICENRGYGVDLNTGLRAPTERTADGGDVGETCVLGKNDRRKSESFVSEELELAVEEERATEHSEISHVEDQSSEIDYNGVSEAVAAEEKQRDEGYLDLLTEAAQLILCDDSDQHHKPPSHKTKPPTSNMEERGGTKRKQQQCWTAAAEAEWYAEFEDTSPVVKSNRGRNQVLPYKYRDSVVEPLVRWSSARHRSLSIGAVPSKRRSK